jgi:methyltransferase (TIGR00027 family)
VRERPSATAFAVTVGLLLDTRDPEIGALVPPRMRELAEACVAAFPRGPRVLRFLSRGWYRSLLRRLERTTVPGIFLHYLMRKLFIEEAVRATLPAGAGAPRQIVVVGAGLDTLGARIALEKTSNTQVIEVDHPLTQAVKRRALAHYGLPTRDFAFVELDLRQHTLEEALRTASTFNEKVPATFVIEGVLMYLHPEQVAALFRELRHLGTPDSHVVFTFMESERADRIRFKNLPGWYAPLLDLWLRRLGEPMHWAIDRRQLRAFLAPLGWTLTSIADRDTFRARFLQPHGLEARALMDGEYVGVAR